METADILCMIIALFASLAFALDLLGAALAALKKKPYNSLIGEFIQNLSENYSLWWMPVVIAVLFAYGINVLYQY